MDKSLKWYSTCDYRRSKKKLLIWMNNSQVFTLWLLANDKIKLLEDEIEQRYKVIAPKKLWIQGQVIDTDEVDVYIQLENIPIAKYRILGIIN